MSFGELLRFSGNVGKSGETWEKDVSYTIRCRLWRLFRVFNEFVSALSNTRRS